MLYLAEVILRVYLASRTRYHEAYGSHRLVVSGYREQYPVLMLKNLQCRPGLKYQVCQDRCY